MKENLIQIEKALRNFNDIDISKYDSKFLNKSILNRMDETKYLLIDEYLYFLEQNKEENQILLSSLQNSFSKFFRNTFTFSILEAIIFPILIQDKSGNKNKEIRIWSSACASGQEVYSLAIVLEALKNGDATKFNYRIFATDVSESQIKLAEIGEYTEEALGNIPLKYTKQWFTKHNGIYKVKPTLKKHITFSQFDLSNDKLKSPRDSIFGDFDLIVCANLLFYYNNDYRKKILQKVINNMAEGGYVVTGEVEREILTGFNFYEIFPKSAIFSRNNTKMKTLN